MSSTTDELTVPDVQRNVDSKVDTEEKDIQNEKETDVDKEKEKDEKEGEKAKEKDKEGAVNIPLARVKRIIKLDKDVSKVSNDALLLITKSTELFLEYFVSEAHKLTKRDKRKILQYKDLAKCVQDTDPLEFLADIIPEKHKIQKTQ